LTIADPDPDDVSLTVISVGQAPITGACVSFTVTVKLQLSSVAAWQVTTVVPMLKKDPEVALQVTGLQTDPEVDGATNVTFAPL
jgi:hypothetical protein